MAAGGGPAPVFLGLDRVWQPGLGGGTGRRRCSARSPRGAGRPLPRAPLGELGPPRPPQPEQVAGRDGVGGIPCALVPASGAVTSRELLCYSEGSDVF